MKVRDKSSCCSGPPPGDRKDYHLWIWKRRTIITVGEQSYGSHLKEYDPAENGNRAITRTPPNRARVLYVELKPHRKANFITQRSNMVMLLL